MDCIHESCGSIDKVWLPFVVDNRINGLKPHPYCIHCGAVKNISVKNYCNISERYIASILEN
jgi:hypothetical protein